jgi:hypothetical protein
VLSRGPQLGSKADDQDGTDWAHAGVWLEHDAHQVATAGRCCALGQHCSAGDAAPPGRIGQRGAIVVIKRLYSVMYRVG